MTTEKKKDYKVPALGKGLDILETLSVAAEPMSLTDLCRALDRNPSELFRMIGFLEERGYINREPHSGNYYLSLKLYELAHMHSPIEQLIKAAAAPMRELALAVKESCHLSVLSGEQLMVLYQQESPDKIRLSVEVGARFDPLRTVSGRLLLAYMEPAERDDYLVRLSGYTGLNESGKRQLKEELYEIRRLGYSRTVKETHIGIRDTAVLVGNPRISLSAALCIPSLITSDKPEFDETTLQALRSCAEQITKTMGVTYV